MAAIQMNVRIDSKLKAEGDAAFKDVGYTPTDVVREVWGFAQRNRSDANTLQHFIRMLRDPASLSDDDETAAARNRAFDDWIERGPLLVHEVCSSYDVQIGAFPQMSSEDYDEMLGEALEEDERRIGRGL